MLLGEYAQKLDEKNRVTVPSRLREPFADGLFVTRGLDGCVAIYARDGWDAFVEQQISRLDPFTREGRQMERYLFGGAVEGTVVEAVAPSRLVLDWRFRDWPDAAELANRSSR